MLTVSRKTFCFCILLLGIPTTAWGNVRMPALFSDHMVLQREAKLPIWGWARPGEQVKVTLPNQELTTKADDDGRWQVTAKPLVPGGSLTLIIEGDNRIEIKDVQVGDVWLCAGQSNMEWSVADARDADLEIPAANYPNLRLITIATRGTQEPLKDVNGHWEQCSSRTVGQFSAVGYFFGRQLLQDVKVPIGLIDTSWGGSSCEAWIRRDLLEGDPLYEETLANYDKQVEEFNQPADMNFRQRLAAWRRRADAAVKARLPNPPGSPWSANPISGQYRPANIYNARLKPLMPFAIRGVIWYQGESNANRAFQYRQMFPLMIKSWREEWGLGDFPFYWVQLADFRKEPAQPGESTWAELREAQTIALRSTPNTGQAVAIDLGEAKDIHPRNKQEVARRLARIALANTYGRKIPFDSARYRSMYKTGDTILIRFSGVNGKLRTIDDKPVTGFAIAGPGRNWVWADATIVSDHEVEVRSDKIRNPFAVRYAWADNPVCNLYDSAGLPVTPFRTDDWPGVTIDAR